MAGSKSSLIGDCTVKELRDEEAYEGFLANVAEVVALTVRTVRSRLDGAHGRTLLRNVFPEEWPDRADEIGWLTVAAAREGDLSDDIAKITGLTTRTVVRRMEAAHGRSNVENVFSDVWPQSDDGDPRDTGDEPDDEEGGEAGGGEGGADDTLGGPDEEDSAFGARRQSLLAFAGLADDDHAWSRPRSLKRLLGRLQMAVPERLRATRFQQVLAALAGLGFELRVTGSGDRARPTDSSPGIGARVCLRQAPARTQSEPPKTPVRLIPSGSGAAASHGTVPKSNYDVAVLRLRLLTAVPSMDRERSADWPTAFVAAAAGGLELASADENFLTMIAPSFRRGTHDPRSAALELSRAGEQSWPFLLKSLLKLNHGEHEVATAIVSELTKMVPGLGGAFPQDAADAESAPDTTRTPELVEPAPPMTVRAPVAAATVNVRTLGALDDMFK